MQEKKTKTLGEIIVDNFLEKSPAFKEMRECLISALRAETVLAQQTKMNTHDLDQVVNVIGTLTKLVTAISAEHAQIKAILTTPKESATMPALFGPKKEDRKAN